MTGKTHLAGGIAACAMIQHLTDVHSAEAATFMAAGAVGALIPDICHAGSKIGRRFPLLARVVQFLFGHRTVTHSLWFLLVAYALLSAYGGDYPTIRDGLLIGMISHLILDAATVSGIQLLWPLDQKVRLPFYTRTGSLVEYAILILLIATIIWLGEPAAMQILSR